MFISKSRYNATFKTIAIVLVCLFCTNSAVLADPDTLAPAVGNPKVYQEMHSMMEDRLAAHQDPIDEFIKQNAIKAKGLSSIPYLEEEFMRCVNACGANNMLTRLKTTITSAGGKIQVIFVKSEDDLPVFESAKAWGHAGTYVTVFALETEKNSKEGRRKIIARLFHEMRARSMRAKELFDEKLKLETPTTPEGISAFIRSARESFEKDNLQLQQQIEQNGRITSPAIAREFANLTFATHPDVMNRDYMMAKQPLPIAELVGKNMQIDGIDYTHELQRILQYRVYDAQLLTDIIADLNLTLKNRVNAFRTLMPKRQMEVYNLASLLGLSSKVKASGVNEETFSFAPGSGISMGSDINTRFSRGYEVSVGSTWSRLKPADYRAISKIQALNFPTNKASVLNLCGGNGHPLMSIAPAFQNSRLVMVDANSKNVSDAMQQMDKIEDSNTYEVKLSDVRSGFGGIPCADQEFDVMTMVGDSEFGMSFDDLYRLMRESIRVLKHNGGLFLIETTHIKRYVSALQQVVQENRSAFDFDIGMHQLAEGVFVIVTGKFADDKKQPTAKAQPAGSIYSIFKYLCEHEITNIEKAVSGQIIAKSAGEEHEARQKALSFESIEDDLRGLLLHLRLIEKAPGSETGKDARYYVPESVKKKSAEILPILEQFRGKDLRPTTALLDQVYVEKIRPILEALVTQEVKTEKTIEQIFSEIEQAIPKNEVWSQVRVPFDPGSFLDMSPEQEKVVSGDKQLEFTSGLLYHGRDGLDEAILNGNISGKIPLTRVAHQWATSDFSNKYQSPAIFAISTTVFNKLRDEGQATLGIVGERSDGFIDPYPEITAPLSLESVEEIWIDMDTYERYKKIVQNPSTELEKSLKPRIEHLFRTGKLKVIPYLRHTTLNEDTSFDSTLANVGRYMMARKLFGKMPLFREKSEAKPAVTTQRLAPIDTAEKGKVTQQTPEDYIVFISSTEVGKRSFSMGRGHAAIRPEKQFSLSETLNYLETHPNDHLMITYLDSLVNESGQKAIDEIVKRFRNRPTSILLGILVSTKHGQYTGIDEAVQEVAQQIGVPRLLELWNNNPSVRVRAMTNPELYVGQEELDSIFRQNRDGHKPLNQVRIKRLPIPGDLLIRASQRKYVHVSTVKSNQSSQSISTGTGLREISPEETLARIDKLPLANVLAGDLQVSGFNHSYSIMVPWRLSLKCPNGRNYTVIKGDMGCGGKGLTHESAAASGLMEMLERYSAVAGSTEDFPNGYVQDKSMIHARRSELQTRGLETLDVNTLNLKFPYQDEELYWVWGEKLTPEGVSKILVPAQLVFIESNFDESEISVYGQSSNGLASGNTMEEAKLHALFEIVERDGDYSIFYSPERCFSLNAPENSDIGQILAIAKSRGITIQFLDLTTEFGIPTYRAFVKIGDQIISGSGTHLDARIALTRALCELSPKLYVYVHHNGGLKGISNELASDRIVKYEELPNYSTGNVKADLNLVERVLLESGFVPSYVDLTRKDLGIPVVRAIVPGLDMPDGVSERQILHLVQELKRLGILGIEKSDDSTKIQDKDSQARPENRNEGRTSSAGATMDTARLESAVEVLKLLPQEWHGNELKIAEFTAELSQLLRIENILDQDKSTFIFSEKVTFDNGLGVLLPKLAKSGMRVAVIATNDRQRALIDELNQGKPENEKIVYADTVADIRTKVHTARYYYFKVTGDPDTDLQGITTFDITEIVKRIIDALGKVSGIVERERLELLHEAARKFAEAA